MLSPTESKGNYEKDNLGVLPTMSISFTLSCYTVSLRLIHQALVIRRDSFSDILTLLLRAIAWSFYMYTIYKYRREKLYFEVHRLFFG